MQRYVQNVLKGIFLYTTRTRLCGSYLILLKRVIEQPLWAHLTKLMKVSFIPDFPHLYSTALRLLLGYPLGSEASHLSPVNAKKQPMSALILLLSVSLLVAVGFLVAFVWSVKKGQYDDDYTPAVRILFDDNEKKSSPQS